MPGYASQCPSCYWTRPLGRIFEIISPPTLQCNRFGEASKTEPGGWDVELVGLSACKPALAMNIHGQRSGLSRWSQLVLMASCAIAASRVWAALTTRCLFLCASS
jgi:hypothetical protein